MRLRATIALLGLALVVAASPPARAEDLVVIVHPGRSEPLSPSSLAQIYLKQRKFWAGGDPILPLNRESESEERELFASAIFGDEAENLSVYWHRKYFSGVFPPATLATDEAVRDFVANDKSAIGYIREGVLDSSVRVVIRIPTGRGGS